MGLLQYVGIVYSTLFDVLLFNLKFTPLELVGVAITISCCIFAAIIKIYKANTSKPASASETELKEHTNTKDNEYYAATARFNNDYQATALSNDPEVETDRKII